MLFWLINQCKICKYSFNSMKKQGFYQSIWDISGNSIYKLIIAVYLKGSHLLIELQICYIAFSLSLYSYLSPLSFNSNFKVIMLRMVKQFKVCFGCFTVFAVSLISCWMENNCNPLPFWNLNLNQQEENFGLINTRPLFNALEYSLIFVTFILWSFTLNFSDNS